MEQKETFLHLTGQKNQSPIKWKMPTGGAQRRGTESSRMLGCGNPPCLPRTREAPELVSLPGSGLHQQRSQDPQKLLVRCSCCFKALNSGFLARQRPCFQIYNEWQQRLPFHSCGSQLFLRSLSQQHILSELHDGCLKPCAMEPAELQGHYFELFQF